MVWSWEYHPDRPITPDELELCRGFRHIHLENAPDTDRPVWNAANDYGIERELQRGGTHFTGIRGVGLQDTATQECQGTLADRAVEHLGTSDIPLIAMRRCLLDALETMRAGSKPPGVDPPPARARARLAVPAQGPALRPGHGHLRRRARPRPRLARRRAVIPLPPR